MITESQNGNTKFLYRAGALAALLSVVFFPIQILVFLLNPPPGTVAGWFALFQNHALIGLLDLDLLLIVDQVLAMLIFLALYAALRRFNESVMIIATVLGLVSTILFIASNPAFAMLSLSHQYASATSEAQRTIFLAAGQTLLSTWQGSAFQVSYLLGSLAPIFMSVVMLQTKLFSKATAWLGIVANVIALGLYVPVIGTYISIFSVLFLWLWYLLMAQRFFQLSRTSEIRSGE
jgi:hypothetical protein